MLLRAIRRSAVALGIGMASLAANAGWDLIQVMPEPDDVALAITALVSAGLVIWRRRSSDKAEQQI